MKVKQLVIFFTFLILLTACQPVNLTAPAPVYDTGVDHGTWVTIPAGEFLEGQFNHPLTINDDYEMMVFPVTNAQYAQFIKEALAEGVLQKNGETITVYYEGDVYNNGRHEERIDAGDYDIAALENPAIRLTWDGNTVSVKPTWEEHPMTMVSWFGAKAYCDYYGWRLPTEMEWEKAARGPEDDRPYPWGYELAHENANYVSSRDPFEDMSSFGSGTTPVGFYNGSVYDGYQTIDSPSYYGVYDMAGNVWEWTADIYDQQHYRYMRGGSKDVYPNNLRVWVRNNATPTFVGPAVGFRCIR